jgi:hypothetical protein
MHRRWLPPLLVSLLIATASFAQYMPEAEGNYPPPEKCQVVVEDMGNVGFRIADAQAFAERTVTGLRKRLGGNETVIYEGLLKSAKDMKRRLAGSETSLQDEQIDYYKAAAQAAQWRVKVRFGKKKGKHWVTATCWRSKDGKRKGKQVESQTWRDKRLDTLKATFAKEVMTFCLEIDPPPKKPTEPAVPVTRPKKKDWSLPPMRR